MKYTVTVNNVKIRTYEVESETPEQAIAAVKAGTAKMTSSDETKTRRANTCDVFGLGRFVGLAGADVGGLGRMGHVVPEEPAKV